MPIILIIEKNGTIKESNIKSFDEATLYKKAGFKTDENFKCHTTWDLELNGAKYAISLYGKTSGRANQENKYELPPPLDNALFFGSCVLVNRVDDELKPLPAKEWDAIYEALYGGFEDIGDEDSDVDEIDDEYDDLVKTKSGYAKDDFVVDDESEIEEDDDYIGSDSDECFKPKKKSASAVAPKKKKADKKGAGAADKTIKVDTSSDQYLDCTNELEMEEYLDEN